MLKQKSFLLKTSSQADVQYANGNLIVGSTKIKKSFINRIQHVRYKAEVVQVYTIGSSYTPSTGTQYALGIGSVERYPNAAQEGLNKIAVLSPISFPSGNTDAQNREIINGMLVKAINDKSDSLGVTAVSLTGGAGFTITDKGGYYGARNGGSQVNYGATEVVLFTNSDGTGFVDATDKTLTTSAVYEFGTGAILLADKPALDPLFMYYPVGTPAGEAVWRALSPVAADGTYAVSGQNYDAFIISFDDYSQIPLTNNDNKMGLESKEFWVFVDNGTGTSTTNLTGYFTFVKAMHKVMADINNGVHGIGQFFDSIPLGQKVGGGAVSGTAGDSNIYITNQGQLEQFIIGTSTIIEPSISSYGWNVENDATATEGSEWTPVLATGAPQQFTVGADDFCVEAVVSATTVANVDWTLGFRTKEAGQSALSGYQKAAAVELVGAAIKTAGMLVSGTYTETNTGDTVSNSTKYVLQVIVKKDGTVSALVNGKSYVVNSAASTPIVLPAGTVMVPFLRNTNLNSSTAVPIVYEFIANENTDWLN